MDSFFNEGYKFHRWWALVVLLWVDVVLLGNYGGGKGMRLKLRVGTRPQDRRRREHLPQLIFGYSSAIRLTAPFQKTTRKSKSLSTMKRKFPTNKTRKGRNFHRKGKKSSSQNT